MLQALALSAHGVPATAGRILRGMTPMLGSGMFTLVVFVAIAAFIILGALSLNRHSRRIDASIPFEADLTDEGRAAQERESRMTRG